MGIQGETNMSLRCRQSFALLASLAGAALIVGALSVEAASTTPKKGTSSTVIVVSNSRSVALTELDATAVGMFLPKAIARNIAAGKKASVSIATDKDCVFDLHGIYADGSNTDSKSVDLCKDKSVNLVD